VDFAIVGSDRVLEEHAEQDVQIADIYRDHTWPIVLATRPDTEADELKDFQTVATSYPRITREAFRRAGNDDVNIIQTSGGTELYAYLEYGGMPVDAISDLTETGNSLRAHGLDRWDPPLFHVSPTLITAKDSDILELFDANLPRKEREIEDPQTIFDASLLPSGDRRQ
jgi:ATP phosphoribosyltransferase